MRERTNINANSRKIYGSLGRMRDKSQMYSRIQNLIQIGLHGRECPEDTYQLRLSIDIKLIMSSIR
jgi:hypothetical protein